MTADPVPHHITEWRTYYSEIRNLLMDLLVNRRVLWRVLRTLGQNRRLAERGDVVLGALQLAYASYSALMVRQMVDESRNKVSLYGLLREIAERPEEISRRWFVSQWRPDVRNFAEKTFDRLAGRRRRHLTRATVLSDQKKLKDRTAKIVEWTNEHVAHRARRRTTAATFRDLRLATENVIRIANKYGELLHDLKVMMPTILDTWEEVLYEPWARRARRRRRGETRRLIGVVAPGSGRES